MSEINQNGYSNIDRQKEQFIAKLEGNSPNQLKNFCRKLGLSSAGTKLGLLDRAAKFL